MPKVIAQTAKMSREDWLSKRLDGIGGSDAAAIANANPYKSPVVCYMEKIGLYQGKEPGEAAYWGNVLEDVVAKEFAKRYSEEINTFGSTEVKEVKIQRQNKIFAHSEYEFMRANIDRLIVCPMRGKGILEVKTANQFLHDEWAGDDVPNQYFIQLQHYLEVMDMDWGYIAVLIGGQKYKHYFIERDKEVGQFLINIESNFWNNHVLNKIPPEMDGADSTTEMLKILYPQSYDNPPVELATVAIEWAEQREAWKQAEADAKEKKTEYENKLKDLLQENEAAFAGSHKVSWKSNKKGIRSFSIKLNALEVVK